MKVGASRNQCRGCNEYFNSTRAFDLHRIGTFGVDRRCATPEEMQTKGMSINEAGYWISETFDLDKLERDENE